MKWYAQAPSNIALIKYMGKKDEINNTPANSSLSYTLNKFITFVEIEKNNTKQDQWEPLNRSDSSFFILTDSQQNRFINHFQMIKSIFNSKEGFTIRSCNNFPASVGLASSASSFAALTICAFKAFSDLTNTPLPSKKEMATISQKGSGSSCRSFFEPWALWSANQVDNIDIPYDNLIHHVILVNDKPKEISSSEAHRRVKTSLLFEPRLLQAENRLNVLIETLKGQHWKDAFNLVWQDFMEMHTLFETSKQPFSYLTPTSKNILEEIKYYWKLHADGPLVTMDAGPNIHILFRAEQLTIKEELINHFKNHHEII